MKIIQSYWSLPSIKNNIGAPENRNFGGFLSEKYNAISWALSCLKIKQFYPDLTLYTDQIGSSWLIDKLQLPYKNVICNLDTLNNYNPLLWAIPKIYVYSIQDQPFLHIDGDVFIWKPFESAFLNHPLIIQNFESGNFYLKEILKQIVSGFAFIPQDIKEKIDYIISMNQTHEERLSINAGILGGTDTAFIKYYANFSLNFIQNNIQCLENIDVGKANVVFEQLLFKILSQQKDISIHPLYDSDMPNNFLSPEYFLNITEKYGFMHLLGLHKKNKLQLLQMESRLLYEFPKMHEHISSIYKEIKIYIKTAQKEKVSETFTNSLRILARMGIDINPNLSVEEFNYFIENIIKENKSELTLLLSDIYQIENILYLLSNNEVYPDFESVFQIVSSKCKKNNSLYDNVEFSLNKNINGIAYLYHEIQLPLTNIILDKIASGVIKPTRTKKINKLHIIKSESTEDNNRVLIFEYLKGWNVLLYFFDNESMTISTLIQRVKENNFFYSGENLKQDLESFVLNASFSNHYLSFSIKNIF